MCSIFASYGKNVSKQLKTLSIRGRDSFGIYNGIIKKQLGNIDKYTIDTKKNSLIIANTRAIPTTEYSIGAGLSTFNQQPFEDNRYVVVHNGIIANDIELRAQFNIKTESKVDSSILPQLFSRTGVVEGMKLLKGSFAIICYDKKDNALYFGKNFMPLVYMLKDGIQVASLASMINPEVKDVPPYTCFKYLFKTNLLKEYKLLKQNKKKSVLVICSGGIDSTTTAYVYKYLGYDVTLLHFMYGQAAQKAELFAVKHFAKDLKSKLVIYDARKIFQPFRKISLLLHRKTADKTKQMLDAETTLSYVPNRNAIFANIAAGVAEMLKINTVAFGGQQMDSVYPDNNPDFVKGINNSIKYSLNAGTEIKFAAPLIHLIKHEIVALGKKLMVPYQYICSCYYPKIINNKIIHCKKCGCCQFKHTAFEMTEKIDFVKHPKHYIKKYVLEYT